MTTVDDVVSTSLVNLIDSGMSNTANYVIETGCFVSTLRLGDGSKVIVVDFESPMVYDKNLFVLKTRELYNELNDPCGYYLL